MEKDGVLVWATDVVAAPTHLYFSQFGGWKSMIKAATDLVSGAGPLPGHR